MLKNEIFTMNFFVITIVIIIIKKMNAKIVCIAAKASKF